MVGSFSAGTANSSEIDSVTASSYLENAYRLNNEGLAASRSGDHAKAEKLHAEALNLKKVAEGENSIGCSLSANALGEEQIKLGKLDEAEKNLQYAVRIRNLKGSHFDAAVSRDNLGRVYEHKGEYAKAREIRMFKTDKMTCSYYYVRGNLYKLANCSDFSLSAKLMDARKVTSSRRVVYAE